MNESSLSAALTAAETGNDTGSGLPFGEVGLVGLGVVLSLISQVVLELLEKHMDQEEGNP